MKKPTIYLDTSVISAYWFDGADVLALARRVKTRDWWETERRLFALRGSAIIETELREGVFRRQPECSAMARRLNYLSVTNQARELLIACSRSRLFHQTSRATPFTWHFRPHMR